MKYELSPREKQIVELASTGHTDSAIAKELGISETTVGSYWVRIRSKVGPYSRPELIASLVRQELQTLVDKLQEQNDELLNQVQAANALNASISNVDMFQQMIEGAQDSMLLVASNRVLEVVNSAAAELFGYERNEIQGKTLEVLIPERQRTEHMVHVQSYFEHPIKRKMADHIGSMGLTRSGNEIPLAVSLSSIQNAKGLRVLCIIRPTD